MPDGLEFEKQIAALEQLIAELRKPEKRAQALAENIDLDAELAKLEAELQRAMVRRYAVLTPWEKTLLARHKDRPYTLDYIRLVFDDYMEMAGDRLGHNDEAVVGGLASLDGAPVVVIGQQKGRDLRERQRRNFGSARGSGFRKALRLAKLAEKFGKPLISFVDTAGAGADLQSEQQGVSEAIARNLAEFSELRTPVVVIVIGEGGSGGALAMAVGDRILMLEHSVYSVISPEGCASILWHDPKQADRAADALQVTAQNAQQLNLVDEVLPEPLGGAHRDPVATAVTIKDALVRHITDLRRLPVDELVERRYHRIRAMGVWASEEPTGGED